MFSSLFLFALILVSSSLATQPLICTKVGTEQEGWYRPDGSLAKLASCQGETESVCLYAHTEQEGWYAKNDVIIEKTRCSVGASPIGALCTDNEDCSSNYCAKTVGGCSNTGNCTTMPSACTREYRPVCGCDGLNYSNPCVAASKGMSIDYMGTCLNPDACQTNDDCANVTYYCSKTEGQCGEQGICVVTPQICTLQMEPVCGCDGQSYANPCVAAANQTTVAHHGDCTSDGQCYSNTDCTGSNMFCLKTDLGACDSTFVSGICSVKPQICTMIYDPVCGCNGETYANDCLAYSAGNCVKARGPC